MLTTEEIKAAVPYADGFELCLDGKWIKLPGNEDTLTIGELRKSKFIYLPLFLTRVIKGMNRECMPSVDIVIYYDHILMAETFNSSKTERTFSFGPKAKYSTIDHAKAACISEVLRRVKNDY